MYPTRVGPDSESSKPAVTSIPAKFQFLEHHFESMKLNERICRLFVGPGRCNNRIGESAGTGPKIGSVVQSHATPCNQLLSALLH